jgi:hypothetical protein
MTVPPIIIIILVHTPSAYQRFSCHNLKTEKKRITRCQRRQKPDLCGRALIHIWLQIKVATEGVCERAKNLQLRQGPVGMREHGRTGGRQAAGLEASCRQAVRPRGVSDPGGGILAIARNCALDSLALSQ